MQKGKRQMETPQSLAGSAKGKRRKTNGDSGKPRRLGKRRKTKWRLREASQTRRKTNGNSAEPRRLGKDKRQFGWRPSQRQKAKGTLRGCTAQDARVERRASVSATMRKFRRLPLVWGERSGRNFNTSRPVRQRWLYAFRLEDPPSG